MIEDEFYIADDMRRTLQSVGADVIGPFGTLARAISAVDGDGFDCAILDLNLHGESAIPIADRLLAEGKSFAIATGYGSPGVPDHLKNVPRVGKPFDPRALLEVVAQLSCAKAHRGG